MTTDPFASPGTTVSIDYNQLKGSLLLIVPECVERDVITVLGAKDAIRADVTVLDGALSGTEYQSALIFPRVLQGQLRSRMGQKVLGRLTQGVAKAGQSAPWELGEATNEDKAIGVRWLSSRGQSTQPSAPATTTLDTPPF